MISRAKVRGRAAQIATASAPATSFTWDAQCEPLRALIMHPKCEGCRRRLGVSLTCRGRTSV